MNTYTTQRSWFDPLVIAMALLLVASTVFAAGEQRRLEATLYDYAGTFRWGEMNQIMSFLDRSDAAKVAPTTFEMERWKQWRVVGYRAQPYVMPDKEHAEQVVEIEISNINTQATRKLIDRQRWRYERKAKAWLLISGLPNLSQS